MDNNNEIKKANRKALPKFILILVISTIIGGVIGFFSVKYGLDALSSKIKAVGEIFGLRIAPYLMLATAIITPIVSVAIYSKAKKLLASWDGENEDIADSVDEKLSVILWLTSSALIFSYFLFAASYSGGLSTFQNKGNLIPIFIGITAFLAIMIEAITLQQKCVDATKKMNPEKTASVYDMKFQKKWLDSCDEAEKILIGKCAFKAYSATNAVCSALAVVLAVAAIIFGIGFLPSLVVCIIWLVNQSVYCKESMKYSKSGNKIF